MDRHYRHTRPQRYHDNRLSDPGVDDWTLDQVRERVRGASRRQDQKPDDQENYDDRRG